MAFSSDKTEAKLKNMLSKKEKELQGKDRQIKRLEEIKAKFEKMKAERAAKQEEKKAAKATRKDERTARKTARKNERTERKTERETRRAEQDKRKRMGKPEIRTPAIRDSKKAIRKPRTKNG